jgi:hypothetical protein
VKRLSPKGSTDIKILKTTVLGEQHATYGQKKKINSTSSNIQILGYNDTNPYKNFIFKVEYLLKYTQIERLTKLQALELPACVFVTYYLYTIGYEKTEYSHSRLGLIRNLTSRRHNSASRTSFSNFTTRC